MPLRGIILIVAVAIVIGIVCRKEMYAWFKNLMTDHDEDENNDEE